MINMVMKINIGRVSFHWLLRKLKVVSLVIRELQIRKSVTEGIIKIKCHDFEKKNYGFPYFGGKEVIKKKKIEIV